LGSAYATVSVEETDAEILVETQAFGEFFLERFRDAVGHGG
jgi:hypothetical protein